MPNWETPAKKQFIAGAVCPRCGEMDKIIMYNRDGDNVRECVRCDFEEVMPDTVSEVEEANEIPTRVTPEVFEPQPSAPEVEAQVVRIIEMPVRNKS